MIFISFSRFSFFFFFFSFHFSFYALATISDSEKNAIVAEHNRLRRIVQPPAIDMKGMKWDPGLAKLAQAWSEKCQTQHGHPYFKRSTIGPDGKPYGESRIGQNLAWSKLISVLFYG